MQVAITIMLMLSGMVAMGCAQTKHDLNSLVEAEQAFCQASINKGIRDAFLAYLAEDAILFRPAPVSGRKFYKRQGKTPGRLVWFPVFADIARAGDMGYTTGPYELKPEGRNPGPPGYGHYVSIWKSGEDGDLKVVLDVGVDHAMPNPPSKKVASPPGSGAAGKETSHRVNVAAERTGLLERDRAFSALSAEKGVQAAYEAFASGEIRVYREKEYPGEGFKAVRRYLSRNPGVYTWEPKAADLSVSGDLGYTYGIEEVRDGKKDESPKERYAYLRIWKREPGGKWMVVLDLTNALPAVPAGVKSDGGAAGKKDGEGKAEKKGGNEKGGNEKSEDKREGGS